MDVAIRLLGSATDDLRSLQAWLVAEDELRGRVEPIEQTPAPGQLGSALDTLIVALGPGGAVSVLLAGLISWIRSRHSDVDITVERRDGHTTIRLSARRIRELNAASLRDEIDQLGQALSGQALSGPLPPVASDDPSLPVGPRRGQPGANRAP